MSEFSLNKNHTKRSYRSNSQQSQLVFFMLKKGIAKDESQATAILLGFTAVALVLVVYLNWPATTEPIDEKFYQDVILDE